MIAEISAEHKKELDRMDTEYQMKFQQQADHEKILRQNNETLTKYCEEIERERANEKQLRLKLEEDFLQNTKNHEEEVQLRLKFESKLNNMHSAHRELESRYKRVLNDLALANKNNTSLTQTLNDRNNEAISLNKRKADDDAQILNLSEEINNLKREA